MRLLFLFLNVCLNSFLAFSFPYVIKFIITCICIIGVIIGYFDGSDMVGEEDIIIIFLPITIVFTTVIILIGISGNKFIYKRTSLSIFKYCLFSSFVFILASIIVMFTLDPLNITYQFKYMKESCLISSFLPIYYMFSNSLPRNFAISNMPYFPTTASASAL